MFHVEQWEHPFYVGELFYVELTARGEPRRFQASRWGEPANGIL